MDYILLNMISGRTILCMGNLEEFMAGKVTAIKRPVLLQPVQTQQGIQLQFAPYLIGEQPDTKLEPAIYPHAVESFVAMPAMFIAQYTQATTGIAVPPSAGSGLKLVQ